jgi:hypothetical protein
MQMAASPKFVPRQHLLQVRVVWYGFQPKLSALCLVALCAGVYRSGRLLFLQIISPGALPTVTHPMALLFVVLCSTPLRPQRLVTTYLVCSAGCCVMQYAIEAVASGLGGEQRGVCQRCCLVLLRSF